MSRTVYLSLTPLEDAHRVLLETFALSPLQGEAISLDQAEGRILCGPVAAKLSSPAFHGAAMDGVAVRAVDTFGASERRPKELVVGRDAHWINTGQPLPSGTDAVIMVEHLIPVTDETAQERVRIEQAVFPWQHVRKMGEDIVASEILFPSGTRIGPYELAALAAAGIYRPTVFRKPKVTIIPTGNELVSLASCPESDIASGSKLPEFNGMVLAALVREAGGLPQILEPVPDEADRITAAAAQAVADGADLVVINAGSSAGSKDYTTTAIAAAGELLLHGIAIMPGKPTAIGRIQEVPVLGIPGYPVSAILSFELLGQALLLRWQDSEVPQRSMDSAVTFQALPSRPGMEEFVRVKLGEVNGHLIAVSLPRGAGTVTSLSRADALVRLPRESEGVSEGHVVPVRLLRDRSRLAKAILAIGSHDNSLDCIDSLLRETGPHSLTSAHVGSMGGLRALAAGRCHVAGCHLLGSDGSYNREAVAASLPGLPVRLVRLVDREQGLILPVGNPRGIRCLADLFQPDIRYINRQRGSGTRMLLDSMLAEQNVSSAKLNGYADEEYTHMNVAVAVASGRADAGLGVKAAAMALGLDFIPICFEEYDLIIPQIFDRDPRLEALLACIRSPLFAERVSAMGGYGLARTGRTVWTWDGMRGQEVEDQ